MLHLGVCSFLEPQPEGTEFAANAIPLHVTMLGNFRVDGELGAVVEPLISGLRAMPIDVVTVGSARFGSDGSVQVALVAPTDALLRTHETLLDAMIQLGAIVDEPNYAGSGFRPHITWIRGERIESGRTLLLETLSLVDLRPDDDSGRRRVLATAP